MNLSFAPTSAHSQESGNPGPRNSAQELGPDFGGDEPNEEAIPPKLISLQSDHGLVLLRQQKSQAAVAAPSPLRGRGQRRALNMRRWVRGRAFPLTRSVFDEPPSCPLPRRLIYAQIFRGRNRGRFFRRPRDRASW